MAKLIEITGKALSGEWGTDDDTGDGIPVLRTTNFTNEGIVNFENVVTRSILKKNLQEKYLLTGDIIIEKSGGSDKQPVGRVIYFDGPENKYLFNNFTGLLRVKDNSKWFPRYVFYSLFANYRRGGTREYENKTTGLHNLKIDAYVSKFEIDDRDYDDQVEICEHLDRIATIIRLRKRELQQLDDLIKALFVEMFGDPEINPKGLEKGPLKEYAEVLVGYPFPSEGYSEEGIDIVGGYNLMHGYIQWDDSKHWPNETGYEQYLLQANDIVMAMDRPWVNGGFKIARVDISHLPALLIQRTACIRGQGLRQELLHILLDSQRFAEHCNVTGSLVPHISNKDINSFQVILPPIELQREFSAFVAQVDKSKSAVQKALDEAQMLFDSLMQKYFQNSDRG